MPHSDGPSSASDLRRLFLDAAREILREPDTPLDLRKVAERAGKSRTAPYLAFGKEKEGGGLLGLKIAVAAEGAREMAERMEAAADVAPSDPIAALQSVAEAFLGFVEENRRLFRLMYGPDLGALPRLGKDAFVDHPEVQALLGHRNAAGLVVTRIIRRAQEDGPLSPDPPDDLGKPYRQSPSGRLLQIAWSAMIGVAFLREDELLRAVTRTVDRERGARLIVESIFGIDPEAVGRAAEAFRSLPDQSPKADRPREDDVMERAEDDVMERAQRDLPLVADDDMIVSASMAMPLEMMDFASPPRMDAAPEPEPEAPPEPTLTRTLAEHTGFNRAARSRTTLSRARILWIDDHPEWIRHGVELLERLGARVSTASTTDAATRVLARPPGPDGPPFDVIISDIKRGSRADAGVRALPEIRRLAPDTAVVFFVGTIDRDRPPPKGTKITNRTNELLHLVMDALEGR